MRSTRIQSQSGREWNGVVRIITLLFRFHHRIRQIISTPIPMEFNHPNSSPYASVKPPRRMGIRKLTKVKHTHQMNAFLIRNVSFFFSLFATTGGHLSIKYSTNCGVCFQKRAPSLRTEKETHTGTQGLQLTCCL